jgi:hypothetical protein
MAKIVTITGAALQRHGYVESTLARWIARKRIKERWKASGRHPYDLGQADLRREAEFYLYNHAELFEAAAAMIARDPVLTKMAELERKRACKYLK